MANICNIPIELTEIIISHVAEPYNTVIVNKNFKKITEKLLSERGDVVIPTKNNIVQDVEDYFKNYSNTFEYYILYNINKDNKLFRNIYSAKIEKEEVTKKFLHKIEGKIWNDEMSDISTIFDDFYFYHRLGTHRYSVNKDIFLPSAEFINYLSLKKSIGNNEKYRLNTIIKTIQWYTENITVSSFTKKSIKSYRLYANISLSRIFKNETHYKYVG